MNSTPAVAQEKEASASQIAATEKKLSQIKIPSVEFQNSTLKEALEFLQVQSIELDSREPDPQKKGVRFFVQTNGDSALMEDTKITLSLDNESLATVLKYTTALAQMKYRIEAQTVIIAPLDRKAATTLSTTGSEIKPTERKMDKPTTVISVVSDKAGKEVPGLEFVVRRQQSYILEFVGRPDEERFQVTLHRSTSYRRNTFIVMKGKESSDGKFRLDDFQEKTAMKNGIKIDVSVLSITYLPDGSTHQLVRRQKLTIPTYFAEFKMEGASRSTYVKKGDAFSLPSAPQTKYKLVEVTEKKAIVELAPE